MSQCNIVIVGELKNKYHKTPNSITTDWRISDGAQRLYQLLLLLGFKQKYITYEFLSSIIKKPNGGSCPFSAAGAVINEKRIFLL